MPQVQLPLFPSGTTAINEVVAYERRADQVVYFNGHLPVFTHRTEGLDRIPEVRTLRDKLRGLGQAGEKVRPGAARWRRSGWRPNRRVRARSTWTGMYGSITAS